MVGSTPIRSRQSLAQNSSTEKVNYTILSLKVKKECVPSAAKAR